MCRHPAPCFSSNLKVVQFGRITIMLTASLAGSFFVKGAQVEPLIFALKIDKNAHSQSYSSFSISL